MADIRKNIKCAYCEEVYHIKYSNETDMSPEFCAFCGESQYNVDEIEEDDGDLDYTDKEREELEIS